VAVQVLADLPTLRTQRLLLRPFSIGDASRVQLLAGASEVYATTLNIPHPYPDGAAERWIATHEVRFQADKSTALAVTSHADGGVIGAISLLTMAEHRRAELAYFIGAPYWNRGYCTEAAIAMIRYGFDELELHKVTSRFIVGNHASERVMIKAGLRKEGELVDEVLKDGVFRTLGVYGLVESEWTRA
jgi:RimJ/RimL family protein N-acetyltransferase